jgi:hypothetical protein
MRIAASILVLSLVLPAAAATARSRPVETIRYETSACFGFCPAYAVTVSSDGRGSFDGRGHTMVRGERGFTVTPAQFAAFRSRLHKVRPNGEVLIVPGKPLCGPAATDQVTVDVRWQEAGRADRHLSYYLGCGMGTHADLRAALIAAPRVLPIAGFIGMAGAAR